MPKVFFPVLTLTWLCSQCYLAADLTAHVKVAQKKIVTGDCQIVLVTVLNPSKVPIKLDGRFASDDVQPLFELQFEGNERQYVQGASQGTFCGESSPTEVPANSSLSEYSVLALEKAKRASTPMFDFPGQYSIRAGVRAHGKVTFSEPQQFEVTADAEIDWDNESSRTILQDIVQFPLYAVVGPRGAVLKELPPRSLLRQIGDLGHRAFESVESPDRRGKHWIKERENASPFVADLLSAKCARELLAIQSHALAMEEIDRMSVRTVDGAAIKEACEYRMELERKRAKDKTNAADLGK